MLAAIMLAAVLMPALPAIAQTGLEGRSLRGLDEANGARLDIGRRGGNGVVEGTLQIDGRRLPFAARVVDGGLSGLMARGGGESQLRLDPLPFGAIMTLIPVAADGTLANQQAEILTFARADVSLPTLPEGFVLPPQPGVVRFAPVGFLRSYAFWPPDGVAVGYAALAPRHRTMIGLFPSVQLDIIWKLCLAPAGVAAADRALSLARSGQGVDCRDVLSVIATLQRNGRFAGYKADVEEARSRVERAVRCAEYFVETKATCDAAGRDMSAAALSLETAATVLDRYR
ncbi:MAG: hypothetical protein AAF577_00805 [Pseudomonadota bacterium]